MIRNTIAYGALTCAVVAASAQPTPSQVHKAVKQAGGSSAFLTEIARQTSLGLPQMTDPNTRVQSVSALGNKLAYTVVLVNTEDRKSANINALRPRSVSFLACTSPTLGLLISDYETEIVYLYTARNTDFLFQHTLNKKICGSR